ncbi:3-hydroxyacyl-CoA dehydrogenase/enoyl-CoA hydratase family protein [Ammoniphilus resinae]|nr:3-hydroxyacyl-CoA dehydrogenase/enoyl-CoA hydratase family protein [Ammoniphilus resinae]
MQRKIRKAAVIGSGIMGSGIAAYLASAGIPTFLLDIVPSTLSDDEKKQGLTLDSPKVRNKLAVSAVNEMVKKKPCPFFSIEDQQWITPGNIEDHLPKLAEVDWIIEAVAENLEVKRKLFSKLQACWKVGTIVSTNTSGISIDEMAEECSTEFKRHFLGTHFFNPPRYMKLLEIIPGEKTDPQIVSFLQEFATKRLGKGVVLAKDTPNFIANRIGVYGLLITMQEMLKRKMTIEEVDELTGPIIGRPKSATFRTLDMVGLDTFASVAANVKGKLSDPMEKKTFDLPDFLQEMCAKQLLGTKTGKGFYMKDRKSKQIYTLDYQTLQYRERKKPFFSTMTQGKNLKERLQSLMNSSNDADQFLWQTIKRTLLYSANCIPEIADDIVAVDQAMKWGFNWELGPFEMWDSIGVEQSVAKMKEEGERIPKLVSLLLESGKTSFYEDKQNVYFSISGKYLPAQQTGERINLQKLKSDQKVIKSNSGATLLDLGDDVACVELHSPHDAIGPDIIRMMNLALDEVSRNYQGLVIASESRNFCVGANLMMILMEAQDENWAQIEQLVGAFQGLSTAMKYYEKPIVAAPFGMTLGGGTEICLPASRIQASAESYMGLVEVGAGLIPAGGGCKELLLRHIEEVDKDGKIDLQPFVQRTFETIALAKVSTSAKDAVNMGYLRTCDGISMNRDFQIYQAKQAVLAMLQAGYQPRQAKKIRVVGEPGLAALKLGIYQMKCSGYISEHDEKIAKKLAHVLCGGDIQANSYVTESYLLDLEREAFLSLCGEPKTRQRMQHLLVQGKPLRN